MAMVTCNVCGGGLAAAADGLLYCKNCGVSYPMEQIQAALAAQNASLWDWQPTADGGAELLQYKGDAPVVTLSLIHILIMPIQRNRIPTPVVKLLKSLHQTLA